MTAVFWVLLAAYQAVAILDRRQPAENAPGRRPRARTVLLQTPLFLTACWFAVDAGALGRSLVQPGYVLAGALAGYAVHAVSLLVTNGVQHLRELLPALGGYFFSWRGRWNYFVENPVVMGMLAVNSIVEEILYRAAAQPLLIAATGRPWASILLVAILFSAAHQHFLRGPLLEGVEFLAYAVLLGALYYATGSLVFVMVIHTVRNFELYYQQFLIDNEKPDNGAAAAPVDGGPARRPLEHA